MDTPLSNQLNIIIPAYRWHSQIFLMALEGISTQDAMKRIDQRSNHIVWMAGNFVNVRYGLGAVAGLEIEDPFHHLFYQGKTLDENYNYPDLGTLISNFHTISPVVFKKLLELNDHDLEKSFPMGMDISFFPETVLNFIGMCIGREDYISGQMALMRRILNYPGINYDVNENLHY